MAIAANLEETERIFSFFDKAYLESDPQYDYVYNAENYEQAEKYYYGENENTKSFKERIDCVYSKELPKKKYTYYIETLKNHKNKEKSHIFISALFDIIDELMTEYAGYDEDGCPYDDDFVYADVYAESFGGPPIDIERFESEFW